MMTLIFAAALAAQTPAAPASEAAMMQHQGAGQPAEHKDCCKDCCKDMAAKHDDHGERGGHAGS
jgi:hypothetical protein